MGAASRASGPPALIPWAPSAPGWLGHNRGEPLMILDYITVSIPQAGPALHDDERATRDVGQSGERLGRGDGGGDGDGVDDWSGHFGLLAPLCIAI